MRVGILTMFNGLASIYSLVNVVGDHIRMLLDAGMEVSLYVCEDMPEKEKSGIYLDPRITWIKFVIDIKGSKYTGEIIALPILQYIKILWRKRLLWEKT